MKKKKRKKKKRKKKKVIKNIKPIVCQKTKLENIILNKPTLAKINRVVCDVNKIVISTYQFIKLYLLYLYENNYKFPEFNQKFIETCMKVVTKPSNGRGKPPNKETLKLIKKLHRFYTKHYSKTITDSKLCSSGINIILKYEAIDMLKNYTNNIMFNYIDRLNRSVNITFNLYDKIQKIKENNKLTKKTTERKYIEN